MHGLGNLPLQLRFNWFFHLQSAIACLCLSDLTWVKHACFQLLFSGVWSAPWIRWVWCLQMHLFREARKAGSMNVKSRTRSVRVGIFCLGVESLQRRDAARIEARFEMTWENTGCRCRVGSSQLHSSRNSSCIFLWFHSSTTFGTQRSLNATYWYCNLANAKWAWRSRFASTRQNFLIKTCCIWTSA